MQEEGPKVEPGGDEGIVSREVMPKVKQVEQKLAD